MLSTTQKQKSSNVLRVYLSSNDRISGTTVNAPQFNINLLNQLNYWDRSRPVYFMLENVTYPGSQAYVMLAICWVNMPLLNHQIVTSNPNHNGILYISEGNEIMRILNRNSIGYPLTLESLLGLSTMNFQCVRHDGVACTDAELGNAFWLNLVFWQDE